MKQGKPKKAPKVPNPDVKNNYMKESDKGSPRKSAQAPMTKKRLSK
jgi:hypothetical protein